MLASYEVTVRVTQALPSEWSLIIGDILTNLRAALDHALFSHATSRRRLTEDEEKRLQYPIVTERENWFGAAAVPATATTPRQPRIESKRDKLALFVNTKVLDVIEKSQPFNNKRMPAQSDPLAVLNSLVNHDKHREVRVVSWLNEEFTIRHSTWKVEEISAPQTEIVDGATIARVIVRRGISLPWQQANLRGGQFDVLTGYGPSIKAPDGSYLSARLAMNVMVKHVERTLHKLKRAIS